MICCVLMACRKNEVDFSFTPTAPRAGQSVQFSNLSESGEDWLWTFGDGATSTMKHPNHVYKNAGTYRISLKVDNRSSWTATKEITVYDTVPTFTCSDSTFVIFKDYTFTAQVYNPYDYKVSYLWYEPIPETDYLAPYFEVTDSATTNSTLHLYFTRPMEEAKIGLRIILNGDTTVIEKSFFVADRATNSVLFRTNEGDFRQRIFGERAEAYVATEDTMPLHYEQDTAQVYNGYLFSLSELQTVFPQLEGFKIASRKIYIRVSGGGLWVANIDGTNVVQIDARPCDAMTLDTKDSRIYWANEEGVWYMPFVGSDNNKFVTVPQQLNTLKNIIKIAADAEPK